MKTRMLLSFGLTAALCVPAGAATNMVVENPTGRLRIQLNLPVLDDVDQETAITDGRIELSPGEGLAVAGGRLFMLTQLSLRFADFTVDRTIVVKHTTGAGVQLLQASP